MEQMGRDPKSFLELFEFLNYTKVKSKVQEASARLAKAKMASAGAAG
jgi:hypothetical protein